MGGARKTVAHSEWLGLLQITGAFLTEPVLRRIWPVGLDAIEREERLRLRAEHDRWLSSEQGQERWIGFVLEEFLGWSGLLTSASPPRLDVVEQGEHVEADFVVKNPDTGDFALLGMVLPPEANPDHRPPGSPWAATWQDRLARLLVSQGVALGLLTTGRWWTLVHVADGMSPTAATFDATTWVEELLVGRAFRSLLRRERLFGAPETERLPALLTECRHQPEVTSDELGRQVRKAAELLVHAFGQVDRRHVIPDVDKAYRGAVTVLMRLLFLLFAEEKGLLPLSNPDYAAGYSATRLVDELHARELDEGRDSLARTHTGWCRLLAVARALHWGVAAADMPIRAYDGGLFDPSKYPWMEDSGDGDVLPVDDLTMLQVLESVQFVQPRGERRRVSFSELEIEEIGQVYERLLNGAAQRASEPMVGLIGRPGAEETVSVVTLEEHAAAVGGDPELLAARLSKEYGKTGIGGASALRRLLKPMDRRELAEATQLLLSATDGDGALSRRLLPYFRLIRRDLRDLPLIVPSDGFYTTGVRRAGIGAYYTPKWLAEEVVEHTLKPLVFRPGPLQTDDESQWEPRRSSEILELRIADIACGSGAFLVSACRYLAARLVEAWIREGITEPPSGTPQAADPDADPLLVAAQQKIIAHCLYGVDLDPLAVQMSRLSLWLLQPTTPFAYLDDRIVQGDSLLGIRSLEQIEWMHVNPVRGRAQHEGKSWTFTEGLLQIAEKAAQIRQELRELPATSLRDLDEKHVLKRQADELVKAAKVCADLVVGAALASGGRGRTLLDERSLEAADLARRYVNAGGRLAEALHQAAKWLEAGAPAGSRRFPLHWPLVFPEVFHFGNGFDAIIGNPPFLGGQKITSQVGTDYRAYLVEALGRDRRGSADLCAYFALRAYDLLNGRGQLGYLATNSLAQGDTREVGLDQILVEGAAITRANRSRPWPSAFVNLEFITFWASREKPGARAAILLDGQRAPAITAQLTSQRPVTGIPCRLITNRNRCFQGATILGLGFTMTPEAAKDMISRDRRNESVIAPYLNGQDLNSRPDHSASRHVINFQDWPLHKAAQYPEPLDQVLRLVKPERDRNNRKVYRTYWWHFAEKRPAMLKAIMGLQRVVVITLVSKVVMPVMVPTGQVFSHMLGVFATDDTAMLALLSSAPHYWWTLTRASTLETRIRYTPSDVFETLPLPELTQEMRDLGDRLNTFRKALMEHRQAGLTATYNLVNDPENTDADIVELRALHGAIDEATLRAYGWTDIEPDHGFYEGRYTVAPAVQHLLVDRLLALNHERHLIEEEEARSKRIF
ncbi:Eco57I restriction-modification methylase domain-containing protein [Nonomuraea sp. NPDC059023]|uniref:Eco57I restriction-modification methylase domain-containing protein n=1 Tax=unclassified Nonomuraea TaxID=2593643 RepID=UPI00369DC745